MSLLSPLPHGPTDIDDRQFRMVIEGIEEYAIYVLDLDGVICSWNRGGLKIKGFTSEEIIGRNFEIFYSPEAVAQGIPALELASAGKLGRLAAEGWRYRKDGSRFWANFVITPLYDQSGALRGYSKITRDTSERRRLEERFRQVVESAPNAMVMINDNGRIEMVNLQTERLFGFDRSELLGQPVEMLVPERFRHAHPDKRKAFFLDPRSRPMGAGRDLYGRRKDGSEFPVEIGLNPIETGEGVMVLSSIVNISERKRLQERFRRVVEFAPNAMVMINDQGRIEMVNTQAEHLFEYAREEMLGNAVEMLVPERFRQGHPGKRRLFFQEPLSRPMGAGRDLFGRRKNGSEFPVEIGLNPIETEDGVMVLSSIVDISDRKQKEERIQAALKEKDLLLGEIHHRVKNNLQVIHSLLNLQASVINDSTVRSMLMDSQNRIQSMALIHQTLYQSNDFANVNFGGFLDVLIPTLVTSYDVSNKNVDLKVSAGDVSLPINSAIPCGLLINELITNALKHGFPGARCGAIEVVLTRVGTQSILLEVSDNGIGIPENLDMEKVETLGLRLVSLLSQQLDGTMTVNRRDPTRFSIEFPVTQA